MLGASATRPSSLRTKNVTPLAVVYAPSPCSGAGLRFAARNASASVTGTTTTGSVSGAGAAPAATGAAAG